MFSEPPIKRRKSTRIYVGNVPIGDGAPIAVQSMTNTNTLDVDATVAQIRAIQDAGADIVRVSVPTMDAAEAFKSIKAQVDIPLVTDIHFDYRIALQAAKYGADCLRINPGNIGSEDRIRAVIDAAGEHNILFELGSMAGHLSETCKRSTVSQHLRLYLSPRCVTLRFFSAITSISLRYR